MTHTEYLIKVGIEIKVARIRKQMTAIDVAKATGLSNDTISGIEHGKYDTKILTYKRIADAIGVEVKDFF